ncbi:hypothetical protein C8F04DRAFT_1194946 [Mycena alexandri]|uniref:Uncharacterized protein n=1 Tax=Mycena alexandri TaxID=1745969 RepID=A0AAD6S690_9AGAR|nr:hypothetical protein C8F04DRAFT_1194946 [Mycena alexandri]
MSAPEELADNNFVLGSTNPADSWDDFGQAVGNAVERYLALPPEQSSTVDDLIPDGPPRSWDDPSWQLGRIDSAWANAAPMATGGRSMGAATRRDLLDDSWSDWNSSRPARAIEIVRDVATDAEADAIERRSELLNNLFWDPLQMPAHFRESVQVQMARMERHRKSRDMSQLLCLKSSQISDEPHQQKQPRKVRLFDEELEQRGDEGSSSKLSSGGTLIIIVIRFQVLCEILDRRYGESTVVEHNNVFEDFIAGP